MGSAIAAHLANAGISVLLLDVRPSALLDDERSRGLTLDDPQVRNRLAAAGNSGPFMRSRRLSSSPHGPSWLKPETSTITCPGSRRRTGCLKPLSKTCP